MAYDINLALERLEKNLQDINSAKEQVEDTINASSQLQNVVMIMLQIGRAHV